MQSLDDLRSEVQEAVDTVWFVQSLEELDYTDISLSCRLHIRPGLFVQVFAGMRSGALYFALIEGNQRIFGIDCEGGAWHIHPYDAPESHQHLVEGLAPKPLLHFMARVEDLLMEQDLI